MLLERIIQAGDGGLSAQRASRELAAVPGFQQALKDQRATLLQFAQLWPDRIRIEKRGSQNVLRAVRARAPPRPQRPRWPTRVFAAPREPEAEPAPRPREPFLRLRRPAEPLARQGPRNSGRAPKKSSSCVAQTLGQEQNMTDLRSVDPAWKAQRESSDKSVNITPCDPVEMRLLDVRIPWEPSSFVEDSDRKNIFLELKDFGVLSSLQHP